MTSSPMTAMARETLEAPEAVARLVQRESAAIERLGERLRQLDPPVIATSARGSSDHAAGYLKYAFEIGAGIPVASLGPSIASIYRRPLKLKGAVLITISQSGRSPDLVALQAAARAAGALTIALLNHVDSPVGKEAEIVVPLHAGIERSVAATKSFIATLAAAAALLAAMNQDQALARAVRALPDDLERAQTLSWTPAAPVFEDAASMYVISRGPAYPVAQEMALKCKETASIHAEAFSTAEAMHGPFGLVQNRFPILALLPADAAQASSLDIIGRLIRAGGQVFTASEKAGPGCHLPIISSKHALTHPIPIAQTFYGFIEQIARARGLDPDRPVNLTKVTETV